MVNYSAMNLNLNDRNFVLTTFLTPDAQGNKGRLQAPCNSPWRTVIVSYKRRTSTSKLILNLNGPSRYEDTSRIRPTKFMGVWWEMITGKSTWSYADVDNVQLGLTGYSKLSAVAVSNPKPNIFSSESEVRANHKR